MMRRLLFALPLILLAWPALAACNPATSSCVGYVDVKSPAYGATGNGSTDDTAHLQAAIDACFANSSCSGVYCPTGTYLISSTLWLDPPNGERATTWTGTGYFTAGVLTISSTISGVGVITGTIDNGTGTGTPTGTILTVTTDTSVVIASGSILTGAGIPAGETIVNQLSGPGGGIGGTSTWTVSISAAATSTSITVSKIGVSSTVFATGANIQTALSGATGPTVIVSGSGPYTANNTLTLGTSGSPVSLSANTPAASTQFTFTMAFFGDPTSSAVKQPGCNIQPNFNDAIALVIGTGQGMRVSDIGIHGPNGGYRGAQNSNGVGVGIGTNGGGATGTLIEDTWVDNFYTLYKTDALGTGALSDSNTFRKVGGSNAYYGILLAGTQAYINDVVEPRFGSAEVFVSSIFSKQVNIFGGDLSSSSNQAATFSISGTSILTSGCASWCFTTTIASPDSYINTPVYNSYMLVTPHFGAVPLVLYAWNSTTHAATFGFYQPWLLANYGRSTVFTIIQNDVQAATSLYAAERDIITQGVGITMDGTHIEDPGVCTTVFDPTTVWGGQVSNEIKNVFFDYDPTLISQTSNAAEIACQESFPFVSVAGDQPLKLSGGDWIANAATGGPLIFDMASGTIIKGSALNGGNPYGNWFNIRVYDQQGCAWSQIGGAGSDCTQPPQFDTMARGSGQWDTDYFLPSALINTSPALNYLMEGELTSPLCGYEPCPWTTPNLSPTVYALVSGSLGALGTYPPIACRTVFKSVDWNTAALTHLYLRSASCPGYSYGQNLVDALVGETVTWSYEGGSDDLYLDAKTLGWMFPGLAISINNGGGAVTYIVTGVYPHYGYISVIDAASNAGASLAGTLGTIYSCASSCTIAEAPFAWTAY